MIHLYKKKVLDDFGKRRRASKCNILQVKQAKLPSLSHLLDERTARTFITEMVHTNDQRTENINDDKKKDILDLIERDTFKLILKEKAGENPNFSLVAPSSQLVMS